MFNGSFQAVVGSKRSEIWVGSFDGVRCKFSFLLAANPLMNFILFFPTLVGPVVGCRNTRSN